MAHMWVVIIVINLLFLTHHHDATLINVRVNINVLTPHHSVNAWMSCVTTTISVCVMTKHPILIVYFIPLIIAIDSTHLDSMARNFIDVIIVVIYFWIGCC